MTASPHTPVMLKEVLAALAPRDGGIYVDATFGAGGYARAILNAADCTVYGFDRDPTAIDRAKELTKQFAGRLILINRPFGEMREALEEAGVEVVDGVVFDLGVSSMHLDEAHRGFSFRYDGPLSMRMDLGKPDAADVIEKAEVRDLAAIFRSYGEEKRAGQLAKAIVAARETAPIKTTGRLAGIIESATPQSARKKIHPATRAFQALRIFVNDELGQLVAGLRAAERLLRPAGRLVAVTFHSLEDRIVKRFLAGGEAAKGGGSRHLPPADVAPLAFDLVYPKAIAASRNEAQENPRARSAKLRAGARTGAAPLAIDEASLGLPKLLELSFLNGGV
ncbi:16S rRNA (cytosine(1402)-N(4))-methyltransferase RsmH [Hyphococcus sp.]|uniref:16S rRNA (cytosine(1402)-N(4))-methyltransferase RsmH n=1 Tax=Hyphococcus sp. TaxID=2038636 RepID=UPI003CCC2322